MLLAIMPTTRLQTGDVDGLPQAIHVRMPFATTQKVIHLATIKEKLG